MAIKRVSYEYAKPVQVLQEDLGLRSTCMFEVHGLNSVDYLMHYQFWIG